MRSKTVSIILKDRSLRLNPYLKDHAKQVHSYTIPAHLMHDLAENTAMLDEAIWTKGAPDV